MPRTVCTNSGLAGSRSILRRSRLTWTSTARSLTEPPLPASASARHGFARARGEHGQHFALAVGQADDLVALAQLGAADMEHELAEAERFSTGGAAAGLARLRMLAMRSDSSRGSNGLAT